MDSLRQFDDPGRIAFRARHFTLDGTVHSPSLLHRPGIAAHRCGYKPASARCSAAEQLLYAGWTERHRYDNTAVSPSTHESGFSY